MKLFEDPPTEIPHPAHPEHKLKLVKAGGAPFRCDGCKEPGCGRRYTCEWCNPNFDLHQCCALAPATLKHHLFENCVFVFLVEPTAPADKRVCDACGHRVRGFVYHCYDCDRDLHPCCATLQKRVVLHGRAFELRKEKSSRCAMCGERCCRFWFYRSYLDGEAVYLHVACMKDAALQIWEADRNGGGDQIMQSISPILDAVLQSRPRRTARGGGLERFIRAIIPLIIGDPTAMIAAVAGAILPQD